MMESSIPPARVALSVGRWTEQPAGIIAARLRDLGHEVELFDNGATMEMSVRAGRCAAVLDLTTGDIAADPDRLTAAALAGVPQLIVPGGCDQWAREPTEVERLAKDIAHKASAARGPTALVVPTRSWSVGVALPAAAAEVFVAVLRLWLAPAVNLAVIDVGIDEPAFIDAAMTAWRAITWATTSGLPCPRG